MVVVGCRSLISLPRRWFAYSLSEQMDVIVFVKLRHLWLESSKKLIEEVIENARPWEEVQGLEHPY